MLASEFMIEEESRVTSPNLSDTISLDESTRRIYKRFRFRFITLGTERIEREFACDGWSVRFAFWEEANIIREYISEYIGLPLLLKSVYFTLVIQYKYFIYFYHIRFLKQFLSYTNVFLHFAETSEFWVFHKIWKKFYNFLVVSTRKYKSPFETLKYLFHPHVSVCVTVYILYQINRTLRAQIQETHIKLDPFLATTCHLILRSSFICFFNSPNHFSRAVITLLELRPVYSP